MKKFNFRLQTLLNIREAAEKKIQNELAKLLNKQNLLRMKQQEYRDKISFEREKLRKKIQDKKHTYNDIIAYERFYDSANKTISLAEQDIQNMQDGINEVRERLVEASRERKVVDKLKEKKWKQYLYELNKEENKENDDANLKIFQMKNENSGFKFQNIK